jgi:hypothetical protein
MRRRLVARDKRGVGVMAARNVARQFCLESRPCREARAYEQIRDLLQARTAEQAGFFGRVLISV